MDFANRMNIAGMKTFKIQEVPSEGLLEDVNAALRTIPTATITETNQLIYTMAAVITEMLGNKINSNKEQHLSWRRTLEAKIKAVQMEVAYFSCSATSLSRIQ